MSEWPPTTDRVLFVNANGSFTLARVGIRNLRVGSHFLLAKEDIGPAANFLRPEERLPRPETFGARLTERYRFERFVVKNRSYEFKIWVGVHDSFRDDTWVEAVQNLAAFLHRKE